MIDRPRNSTKIFLRILRTKIFLRILHFLVDFSIKIMRNDLILPIAINDPRTYHRREWKEILDYLFDEGEYKSALLFALTRWYDVICLNQAYSHKGHDPALNSMG